MVKTSRGAADTAAEEELILSGSEESAALAAPVSDAAAEKENMARIKKIGHVPWKKDFKTNWVIYCLFLPVLVWLILFLFPRPLLSVFVEDQKLLDLGVPAMHLYFFGFFFMAFQFTGQSTFVGLGKAKQAVFFSLFRKIIIVVPLTLLLPRIGALGVNGVFIAEPISNLIGGLASFLTMIFTLRKMIKSAPAPLPAAETTDSEQPPAPSEDKP